MPDVLRTALASKKFLAFLVTLVVVVGNAILKRFGLELDNEQVALIVGAGAAYILAQGVADHGKEAAKATTPIVGQVLDTSSFAITPSKEQA